MDIKNNAKNKDTWLRGLFILVFSVISYFLYGLIWLLVIFQFFTKVITGNLNNYLEQFSKKLTLYALQILDYITYQSEERPFPFSPFPGGSEDTQSSATVSEETTPKKVTNKKEVSSDKDEGSEES